jgi:acyl carrier protein
MTYRPIILMKFKEVAEREQKQLAPLHDDMPLLETGLDSLCYAIVVALLEDELGLDPFSDADEDIFPVTFKDFVRLYDDATV